MRVAIYSEVYRPIRNGVVASVDALACGLADRGIDVTCYVPFFRHAVDDRAFVRRIASLPLPTRTGYRLVVPFVRDDARASIVHAHSPFVTGALALRAARRGGLPLVFTYHTRLREYAHYAPFDARVARFALDLLVREFANAADVVVVPTRAIEAELRSIGVRSEIAVVATSVDAARFAAAPRDVALRRELGATDDTKLLLWAGRLAREKNLSLALEALARLERCDVRLAIVGDGPLDATSRRAARGLGLSDRVVFAGGVAPEAMPRYYASADLLAFTSVSETQGLVLSEARAAGLPVVAVDTPVSREVLGPDGTFASPQPAAFARAIAERLERGPAREAPPQRDADFVDTLLALYRRLRSVSLS